MDDLSTYIVITPFFPTADSFRGPFILDQVKAIKKTGKFEVVVLKPKPWYLRIHDYEYEGIKVHYINNYNLPSGILPGLFDWLSVFSLESKIKSLGKSDYDITVAHGHTSGTGFWLNYLKKRNNNIKTILQYHGFDVLSLENGVLSRFSWHRNWVKQYGIKQCNKIDLHVGVSRKILHYLESFPRMKIKQKYVLYNGIDTSKFYPVEGLKDPDFFIIGCIANFWKIKDQMTLIKAVEIIITNYKINNIRVKFVGTGPELETCRKYIKQNNLSRHFSFIDTIEHNKLVRFYNELDLFVLPSYYEGLGSVYLEAWACGSPFIGVKNQGIEEVIAEDAKLYSLVPAKKPASLASLILKYYKNHLNIKSQKLKININIQSLISNFISQCI